MSQSWSRIRKNLEQDLLCEGLRGRVQYFFTIYHGAPDEAGRFAVRVDGREIFRANAYNEGKYDRLADQMKREQNVPRREWDGKHILYDEENRAVEEDAVIASMCLGVASTWDALASIEEFLQQSIDESLHSENYLHRMLAIVDRRVGRRTLVKLEEEYRTAPDWLRHFYRIRCEAEGLTKDL